MELQKLDESYRGYRVLVEYKSDYYFDIETTKNDEGILFNITKRKFETTISKNFEIVLFDDQFKNIELYGYFDNDQLLAFVEISHEKPLNRLRITNIYVSETLRSHHVGSLLMERAISRANELSCRSVFLETESCNHHAITFYQKYGFEISGFDKFRYSNEDIQLKEVDLEMTLDLTKR